MEPVHCAASSEHVAKQIVGDNDVELFGIAHQLHGAIVGENMGKLHVGEFCIVKFLHFLAP